MNCTRLRELYSDYADGILDEADEIAVRRHLSACPECHRLDEAFRWGVGALRGLPRLSASEDFDRRLQERILRACQDAEREPVMGLGQLAGVAGALAVVVAAGVLGWQVRARSTALVTEPPASRAVRPSRTARTPAAAGFAHDTAYGRDPFRILPASQDSLFGSAHRIDITIDWMAP